VGAVLRGLSAFASLRSPALWILLLALAASWIVGRTLPPTWTAESVVLDVSGSPPGQSYRWRGRDLPLPAPLAWAQSELRPESLRALNAAGEAPRHREEVVLRPLPGGGHEVVKYLAARHWGPWSLLPAFVAVLLCWVTREPISSLFGGIVAGAFLLRKYDITEEVLVSTLGTESAAGVLLLYLWLLGGLMGVWARSGAARAFAEWMAANFVRGPRTAKLTAWLLGVVFFQGGTVSAVLVGTTVKPLADREGVSHEELSYVVDSTASPIASQLAFNAWPGYVQGFIYVAGVSWLATEADRLRFFFQSVPFCFYAIFAVLGTFLLSVERAPFVGSRMRAAIRRARETGQLDAPDAEPLAARELSEDRTAPGFRPSLWEFVLPLGLLIGVAVGTFITTGAPQVRWAFGAALLLAASMALGRGMGLRTLMEGVVDGLKGVVAGSVILLLAITIGAVSKQAGGGIWLVESLGEGLPYWALPVLLQLMTMTIAFSTGSSWGTYAVAFPLAMPLAWAVAGAQGLAHPEFYMTICFAAVMDGSVYGDQCSPISDTTVLSAMCTGCDLMDHVKTQIPQATMAAALAAIAWTAAVWLFA
jgi:Na+/H+ antiporter NhaC